MGKNLFMLVVSHAHPFIVSPCTLPPSYFQPGVGWGGGGGVLSYMVYIGMCCCEGYGFQAVYSRIGYVNQSIWV